jgi:putative oxidoreductase
MINIITENPFWRTHGLLVARIIMGGVFLMAAYMKFTNISGMAGYIAAMNFPFPTTLIWIAAIFELIMGLCIVTGVFFRGAALLLGVYAIFLAIVFHGPSLWGSNQDEFGFFVDHFVMLAGLLFMLGHGPGRTWSLTKIESKQS